MRVCVFSDIHGNQYALREFFKILPDLAIDEFIFCGDIFGYYYGQGEVIQRLCELQNLVWVLGNHDKNFVNAIDGVADMENLINKYGNSYSFTVAHANASNSADILRNLLPKMEISMCGIKIVAAHGTINDPLGGRIYPKDVGDLTELANVDICVMGHTHFRLHKRVGNTMYLNPGSLGQPRDRQKSSFAILSLPERSVEFINISYNTNLLDAEIRQYDPGNEKLLELLHRSD